MRDKKVLTMKGLQGTGEVGDNIKLVVNDVTVWEITLTEECKIDVRKTTVV